MKRTVRVLVLFFISLSGSSTGLALAQNEKVRLAWVAVGGAMAPVWIAQELNPYKKYGLDAELTAGSLQDFPISNPGVLLIGAGAKTCPCPSL